MAIPNWFVIVMGLGVVFIGLIFIILLCKILGAICSLAETKEKSAPKAAPAPAAAPAVPVQGNRQEIIVAIGVAIAEEIGVSAEAIRIKSIKTV
jgi:sodium pump decarboxylase gamma subunit